MTEWWNSLDAMMKIIWAITLSASLVFLIQTVMTFLGMDHDGDFDINSDGDFGDGMDADSPDLEIDHSTGAGLLTFRNFVNFFLGFGWSAVLLRESIASTSLLLLVSVLVGALLVYMVMMIFKWLGSMQQSGTINVFKSAAGCQGTVYLTIPGHRAGEGKVQITINDSVREYAAVTDGEPLPTGASVQVVDVVSATTLLVEEIQSAII